MGICMQAGETSPRLSPSIVETSKAACHRLVHFPSQKGHFLLTILVNILHRLVMKHLMPRSLCCPSTCQDHEDVNCSKRKTRPGEVREVSQEEPGSSKSRNFCDEHVISMEMRPLTGTESRSAASLTGKPNIPRDPVKTAPQSALPHRLMLVDGNFSTFILLSESLCVAAGGSISHRSEEEQPRTG